MKNMQQQNPIILIIYFSWILTLSLIFADIVDLLSQTLKYVHNHLFKSVLEDPF